MDKNNKTVFYLDNLLTSLQKKPNIRLFLETNGKKSYRVLFFTFTKTQVRPKIYSELDHKLFNDKCFEKGTG